MGSEELAAVSSLWFSNKRRVDVLLMLVAASVTLYCGLSQPLISVEKALILRTEYSVWGGVVGLWDDGDWFLAGVVFFFSFIFPIAKLALLTWIWLAPLAHIARERWLRWLEVLGKWSMLDVFVVAILIVATKLGPLALVKPKPGVYYFCAAILGSMIATLLVRRVAIRAAK
jgi:paraquat-inducible protein A